MDSENINVVNGGDSNGLPSEKPQTLNLDQEKQQHRHHEDAASDSDGELETPNGSEGDEAVRILHQEIQELRRDRSEHQRNVDELLAQVEQSELSNKALAAHASFLEGELAKTQEDLGSAEMVAAEAENEAKALRLAAKKLEEKVADLEVETGRKDGEIRVLKEELRVSEERRALKEEELRERSKELEVRTDKMLLKSKEAMEEEAKIRVSREEDLARVIKMMKDKNSELERDLVHEKSRREVELEKAVKDLKRRNLELEAKIEELSSKGNGETFEKIREMEIVMPASASKVSIGTTAAAAASTGALAAVLTALYLQRQR